MSTVTLPETAPAPAFERPTGKGLSFGRLLHVELRKQVDTRGGRGLLIAIAVMTMMALAGVMYFQRETGASYSNLVSAVASPQGMLIPVLGIITACNEWSQRTALITFTQEPRRWRVVAAKTLAAILWATAFLLLAWGLAAVCHMVSMSIAGNPVDFDLDAKAHLGGWIGQLVGVLMGLGFGFLLLITPLAIAAYFVLPTLVAGITMGVPALQKYAPWVNTTTPPIVQDPMVMGMPEVSHPWAKFATTILLWVVLPYVAGAVRVLRREVK
ncbi:MULTISPECIES: hypothetical protein [unclassified Luteococcus]|uniref:hypothetical protein n=1 Tax=unclassified Luteococcus TaxID=2639923 RepID=UPI00313BDDF3